MHETVDRVKSASSHRSSPRPWLPPGHLHLHLHLQPPRRRRHQLQPSHRKSLHQRLLPHHPFASTGVLKLQHVQRIGQAVFHSRCSRHWAEGLSSLEGTRRLDPANFYAGASSRFASTRTGASRGEHRAFARTESLTRSARESTHHACPQARSNARAQRRASLRAADCIQGEFVNKDKPAYRKRKPEERRSKKDQVVQAQSSANSEAARSCAGSQPSRKRDSVELGSNASAALSLSLRLSLRKSMRSRSSCPSLQPSLGTSGTADTEAEPGRRAWTLRLPWHPSRLGKAKPQWRRRRTASRRCGQDWASGRRKRSGDDRRPAPAASDNTDQAVALRTSLVAAARGAGGCSASGWPNWKANRGGPGERAVDRVRRGCPCWVLTVVSLQASAG